VVRVKKEKVKYFNYSEFDSPDVQGSGQMMDKTLLEMLDEVRDKFDKPIHITSGFRTPAHNEAVGGKMPDADGNGGSSHLKGLAVDIACNNSTDRFDLINCLLDVGFSRIGVGNTFIHADIDQDKTQGVIWIY
jgi:uncharacterized protein YcbK (DUF882 family)